MESHARALGHPIHPMLIVFPLGLFVMSLIFDILYYITGAIGFASAAFWDIIAGVIIGLIAAAFGLTMDELGFTDTSNRSVGESQQNVVYRRAVAPVVALASGFLTRKVRRWLDPRFTVSFGGIEEPEDFAVRAEAFSRLIPLGVVSPAQAAHLLHLPTPDQRR